MKKHDEGYALVLVLVVIVVLGLIAGTLMSFSLSNLQSQTASIERMKAKYEAAGEIEKAVALLSQGEKLTVAPGENIIDKLKVWITSCGAEVDTVTPEGEGTSGGTGEVTSYTYSGTVRVEATVETTKIQCTLEITGEINKEESLADTYLVKPTGVTYKDYDISTTEGGGS